MELKQIQSQVLKLKMTTSLRQSIELLSMSTLELEDFLEDQVLENPFLSVKKEESGSKSKGLSSDWTELTAAPVSFCLEEEIFSQLHLKAFSKEELRNFRVLIQYINENGFFEITDFNNLPLSMEPISFYIEEIQKLEPAGIGARSIEESLLLQLSRKNGSSLAKKIVEQGFSLVVAEKWRPLAKLLSVSIVEIQTAIDEIAQLHLYPVKKASEQAINYITPDLLVNLKGDEFEVIINERNVPVISFQDASFREYRADQDEQLQTFLDDRKRHYESISQGLAHRNMSLLAIGYRIVHHQRAFLTDGPSALNPLSQKQIAEDIGVHESTVSRLVRGKYIQTPFGTFELNFFFSTRIGDEQSDVSVRKVKELVQTIVTEENKLKPLSDEKICQTLSEKGILISRRTVAKYRDQLGIPSSTKRKRYT
ncbi:RNA polymerase factor sigma-54 [Bacillus sp. 2205SS5-2]|uniref:RNA polymerase factor sigma-54 n=1 Tax=Bacillus sp. 2205SS5-2 TaxID=3109031 RepID=UPI0030061244